MITKQYLRSEYMPEPGKPRGGFSYKKQKGEDKDLDINERW